jgi:hypothetical protein
MRLERRIGVAVLPGVAIALIGCPAFYYRDGDVDRTPTVNTGAGASIIYPGQSAPPLPGGTQPGTAQTPAGQQPYGATQAAQPPPEYQQPYGSGASRSSGSPSGGGITMIGGTQTDEKRHNKVRSEPIYWKYVMAPFALLAAPFKFAIDTARGAPEPGPAIPPTAARQAPAQPAPVPIDYETQALRGLQQELAQRNSSQASRTHPPDSAADRGLSIANELAALRAASAGTPAVSAAATPPRPPAPEAQGHVTRAQPGDDAALVTASGLVDRNGDGRTDQWIFRSNGEISREMFDENFDGTPDRTLDYDLATHRVSSIEEDSNQDGHTDTWTTLRDGAVVRTRVDSDHDGQIDTWNFYKNGQVVRLERDSNGNGFRDDVVHYRDGRMIREEKDDDGDGVMDVIKHFDASEHVIRVEEDSDGDGRMDVISHYEGGRLARREILDATLLDESASNRTEHD